MSVTEDDLIQRRYIEDIKKNAPTDADFYMVNDGVVDYVKCISGFWYVLYNGNWDMINSIVMSHYKDSLRRLEK